MQLALHYLYLLFYRAFFGFLLGIYPEIVFGLSFASLTAYGILSQNNNTFKNTNWLICFALTAVYVFPLVFASLWMGSGIAPPVFFNVDFPYYLSQAFTLAHSTIYPPTSLNNVGYITPYHYGVQLAAALISRLTDCPVHKALFWIVIPFLLLSTVCTAWCISNIGRTTGFPPALGLVVILFTTDYPLLSWLGIIKDNLLSNPLDYLIKIGSSVIEI